MKKLFVLFTIISFNAYGQKANWKTYTKDNYSIQYPPAYDLEEYQQGTVFMIIFPVDSANPTFNRNINLIIQDLKGTGMDLDKYNETSVKQIKQYLPNDSILMDKKEKDAVGECWHLIYMGDAHDEHLQFEQYYRIINEKAYVLTLTTQIKQWDKGHLIGEEIMSTFKINQ
jgi:hypothetical protein